MTSTCAPRARPKQSVWLGPKPDASIPCCVRIPTRYTIIKLLSPGPAKLRRNHWARQGDPVLSSTNIPPSPAAAGTPPHLFASWEPCCPARVLHSTLAGLRRAARQGRQAPTHTGSCLAGWPLTADFIVSLKGEWRGPSLKLDLRPSPRPDSSPHSRQFAANASIYHRKPTRERAALSSCSSLYIHGRGRHSSSLDVLPTDTHPALTHAKFDRQFPGSSWTNPRFGLNPKPCAPPVGLVRRQFDLIKRLVSQTP